MKQVAAPAVLVCVLTSFLLLPRAPFGVDAAAHRRAQTSRAGAEQAEQKEDCSLASLQGSYGGVSSGTNVSSVFVPAGPLAIVNLIVFDGAGHLAVPVETMSLNGDIRRLATPVEASYTVAPDCTGALHFAGPNTFDFVIVADGHELFAIHADAGFVHTVVLKKQ